MITGENLLNELIKTIEADDNSTPLEMAKKLIKAVQLLDRELKEAYQEGVKEGIKIRRLEKFKIRNN